jgi:hypothetical protein
MNHNQEFRDCSLFPLRFKHFLGDISCRSPFVQLPAGMGTSGNQTLAHAECFALETNTWSSLPQSLGRSRGVVVLNFSP